tara:strand:+ start:1658 stop:1912 length:255 start_codon:yes stop_codon:yes gene_type:complete
MEMLKGRAQVKARPRILNGRSPHTVHHARNDSPKRGDTTLCGVEMKGSRWRLSDQDPTCGLCLDAARGTSSVATFDKEYLGARA